MLINELAQWAVLAFMAVFVFGLTRQLGSFLLEPKEEHAVTTGPDLDKPVPKALIRPRERSELAALMKARGADAASVLVVDEDCPGCSDLLDRLAHEGAPENAPIMIVSRLSSEEHVKHLRGLADIVVVDPARLKEVKLDITPFLMVVDRDCRVVHKQLTPDLRDAFARWRLRQQPDNREAVVEQIGAQNGAPTLTARR